LSLEPGTICRINKSYGPFSSGTLVEVKKMLSKTGYVTVKLLTPPTGKYLENVSSYGIGPNGIFDLEFDKLTPRRYRLGR
jgi:hypothetical protein